jgi:hypothetical protein
VKRLLFAPLAAIGLAAPSAADGPAAYRGYEAPAYSVVRTLGAVEIRDYPAMTLAEVRIEGGRSRAVGRGFRILAGYIFGANAGGEKIAMTTPVEQAPVAAGDDATVWAIRFVMPRGASPDSLPAPEDPAIRLIVAEPGRQAVLRFSGLATPGTVAAQSAELLATLDAAGIAPTGPVATYFYDDPFTLPWRRRNEVAVPVE